MKDGIRMEHWGLLKEFEFDTKCYVFEASWVLTHRSLRTAVVLHELHQDFMHLFIYLTNTNIREPSSTITSLECHTQEIKKHIDHFVLEL